MAMRLCSGTAAQAFSPATAAVTARLTSSCVADGYYFSVRGVGGRTVDVHFHVAVSSCVVLSNFLNVVARLPRHSQFLVGGNDLDGYGRAGA